MPSSESPDVLWHGTTQNRAARLLATPPDPNFVDPGGDFYSRANGVSFVIAGSSDIGLGSAEKYARGKATLFPNEGGAVILEVEVPTEIVDLLRNHPLGGMVVASHEIRFEP